MIGKSDSDEEEESSLIWALFGIAGVLVAIAAYITFKQMQFNQSRTDVRQISHQPQLVIRFLPMWKRPIRTRYKLIRRRWRSQGMAAPLHRRQRFRSRSRYYRGRGQHR